MTRQLAPEIPSVCAAVLLLFALGQWPYGYYTFLRVAVTAAAAYNAFRCDSESLWLWLFLGIALLFNPLFPVHMRRADWAVFDVAAAVAFAAFAVSQSLRRG
jgi:hypothetical protein